MPDDDDKSFARMKFVGESNGADIARLQERVRMMEATVGEFRGDLKEIKVAVQLSLSQNIKTEGSRQTWGLLLSPAINLLWSIIGAALMYFFALRHWS